MLINSKGKWRCGKCKRSWVWVWFVCLRSEKEVNELLIQSSSTICNETEGLI